jgi:hypothetical protein
MTINIMFLVLALGGVASAQTAGGSWIRSVAADKMYGTSSVLYLLPAESSDGSRERREPQIAIVCQKGHFKSIDYAVGAILATDEIGGPGKTMIQMRVDDKRVRFETWDETSDFQHAFSQTARLKELLSANRLVLRVTTFTGEVITDEFAVAGLNTAAFHEDCGH